MSLLQAGGEVNQDDHHVVQHAGATLPSHDILSPAPAPMADHHPPCPYEDKIVANPTTARVLLMFLRDFVESRTVYTPWPQSCFCPMMKCYQAFSEPLALIEHLLNCPELPRGEFECWKCENWHGFPTNEKDWAEWLGWKSQQANDFQRKRSFSFKVKEAMNPLRRRSSVVKAGPPQQPPPTRQQQQQQQSQQQPPSSSQAQQPCTKHHHHGSVMGGVSECQWGGQLSDTHLKRACQLDLRLDSQQCGLPFNFNSHHHHHQGGSPEQAADMSAFNCQTSTTTVEDSKLGQIAVWPPDIDPDEMCDISATPSAIFEPGQSQPVSSSTSRTSFFPNMTHEQFHQHLVQQLSQQQQFLLSPQLTECHPSSPLAAMAGSDAGTQAPPPPVDDSMFITSPVDVESQQRAGGGGEGPPPWWGPRPDDLLGVATSMAGGQDPAAVAAAARVHMLQGGGVPRELSISSSHPSFDLDQNQAQAYAQMPRVLPFHNCDNPHHRAALYPGAAHTTHDQHQQHHHHHHPLHAALTPPNDASSFGSPASVLEPPPPQQKQSPATTDDTELVCDQCNWKPRGVTENLKGYLRKHKNTHKGLRYPCEFEGCTKTFGRPDNLKAHKRDKHGIDETANSMHDEAVHAHHAIKQQQQQQQQALVAQQQQHHHVQQQHHVQQAHAQAQQQSDQQSQSEERAPRDSSELAFRGIRPEHAVLWGGLNL